MPAESPLRIEHGQGAVLLRQARDVAHQCLYYLYHVGDSGSPGVNKRLDGDRQHAFGRVADLVNSVHLPEAFAEKARTGDLLPLGTAGAEGDRTVLKGATIIRDLMVEQSRGPLAPSREAESPSVKEMDRVIAYWTISIWWPVNSRLLLDQAATAEPQSPSTPGSVTAAEVDDLIRRVQTFLALSRPWRGRGLSDRARITTRRTASRNAALLVGLATVALVYAKVEAVHNLVFNMGWPALLPFASVFVAGPLTMILMGLVPVLSPGKGAFWRIAFPALSPVIDPDIVGRDRKLGGVIGRAEAAKLIVLLGWLSVAQIALGRLIASGYVEHTHETLFILDSLCLLTLVFLHWLDHWDFLVHRPVRMWAMLIGIIPLGISLSGWWGEMQGWLVTVPAAYVAATGWAYFRRKGITWARAICALIAVLAAVGLGVGGSTRSKAIWGDAHHKPGPASADVPSILTGKGGWPAGGEDGPPVVVIAASGGGSRAAMYTAYFLESLHRDQPEVAKNIQAISSVSGGSLATAAYVALRRKKLNEPQSPPFWVTGSGQGGKEQTDVECESEKCFHEGALVHAVSKDFLLATLKGALVPFTTRGQAIEAAFSEDGGLGETRMEELVAEWNPAKNGAFPIPLLNSCTLDDRAVVLTPLHREYYLPPSQAKARKEAEAQAEAQEQAQEEAQEDPRFAALRKWYRIKEGEKLTWVLDRDEILAFSDLNPLYSPSLAEAVRASANFPFGFPLVEVHTPRNLQLPYRPTGEVAKLTDGGVLSNSGLWTLFHLLTQNAKVVKTLKKRGVLLLVVDASHMPEYADDRRDLLSLYSAIADQAPIAQNLHRRMFDLLKKEYGPRLSVVQLDIPATVHDNVLTTWALDNESKRKLRRSFCRMWRHGTKDSMNASERIEQHWKHLNGKPAPTDKDAGPAPAGDASGPELPFAFVRPPLD